MKLKQILTLVAAATTLGVVSGCSALSSENYVQKMNQPQIQGGDSMDREDAKLNPQAWNQLNITKNAAMVRVDKDGDMVDNPQDGYLFMRANVVNNGKKAVEVKWRCKFYSPTGMPLGEEEYNKKATTDTGLGWHRMIVWPVGSKSQTDDANVMRCISPYKKATDGKFEVHDMANDVTIFDK